MTCRSILDELRFASIKLAVAHARAGGDRCQLARCIARLGEAYESRGESGYAELFLAEALGIYRSLPDAPPGEAAKCARLLATLGAGRQTRAAARLAALQRAQ